MAHDTDPGRYVADLQRALDAANRRIRALEAERPALVARAAERDAIRDLYAGMTEEELRATGMTLPEYVQRAREAVAKQRDEAHRELADALDCNADARAADTPFGCGNCLACSRRDVELLQDCGTEGPEGCGDNCIACCRRALAAMVEERGRRDTAPAPAPAASAGAPVPPPPTLDEASAAIARYRTCGGKATAAKREYHEYDRAGERNGWRVTCADGTSFCYMGHWFTDAEIDAVRAEGTRPRPAVTEPDLATPREDDHE